MAYTIIFPTLEAIGAYICQWIEVKRAKLIVEQTKLKKEIADIEEDDKEEYQTRVIGFQTSSSDDEEYDEEEEDEDD